MKAIQENDLVLIIHKDKKYLKRVMPDKSFHGKGGVINFPDLIGMNFGIRYLQYDLYEPTMEDIIMYGLARETQIVFPKDSFFIPFKLNLKHGSRVFEAGTGSGALTYMFSHTVGPEGTVVSLEKEERHFRNAKKNIERFLPWKNVEMHNQDIMSFSGEAFDAAFIDVREPWIYLEKVRSFLKESGSVGMIVPTANQVSDILKEFHKGFGNVEVLEIMMRKYKTVAERVRPEDRMVAHTGYLLFGRKLTGGQPKAGNDDVESGETMYIESEE
ncbi:MAG: methyltransferase type 11 [Syntrophus sp. (in: bacteria)]|nr:methyltransferase type 11 [Syntrophus sp. (in: bacteria)]